MESCRYLFLLVLLSRSPGIDLDVTTLLQLCLEDCQYVVGSESLVVVVSAC